MARITQLLIQAEHEPGTLATICSELASKAVNITAILAAPDRTGGLRLVATPLAAAKKVLGDDAASLSRRRRHRACASATGPGALGKVTRKLADANVNILYAYGSIVKGEQRALIVLGVSDVAKAEKLV